MATKKKADKQATPTAAPAIPPREPGMKIIAMQVENIMRVKFARVRPKGAVVTIGGKNEQGKTSLLNAIDWAINGTTNVPTMPIRKGQTHGSIQVDLGDFKVERWFTEVKGGKEPYITKLRVYGRNREQFPTPQKLLDEFKGAISFDPLAFIRMAPKKKSETLRRLVTLDVDLDQVEADKKTAYDSRRDAGRDLDSAKARLSALPEPAADLPEKPIDTAELTKKLQGTAEHNSAIARLRNDQQAKRNLAEGVTEKIAVANRTIADLRKQILDLEEAISEAVELRTKLTAEADAMKIGEEISTVEVAAELNKAQDTNAAIQRRELRRSVEAQVTEAQKRWDAHDATTKAKDKEKADAIARAKMPIEKLSFGDDMEVMYDGIPFDQASGAQKIRISVALGMASNPKLRVLRIPDGALLDSDSMKIIAGMAEAGDYQFWIERGEGGETSVVMEDGEATGDEAEAKQERLK